MSLRLVSGLDSGRRRLQLTAVVVVLSGMVAGSAQSQDHDLQRVTWPFPVAENGLSLRYPFLGGFDSPRPQFVDLDRDEDLDLLLQEHVGSVMFFRNEGSPESAEFYLESERFEDLDVGQWFYFADLDGDQDVDLLTERPFGLIRVYRNVSVSSEPRFESTADTLRASNGELIVTEPPTLPQVYDVDCNGRPDLMIGRQEGTISRYEWNGVDGRGNPIFDFVEDRYQQIEVIGGPGKATEPSLHGASSIEFGDVDADGDPDLLWGDFNEPNLILFRNDGSCSSPLFVRETDTAMQTGSGPANTSGFNAPRLADIDSDGAPELFVGVQGGAFITSSSSVDNFYHFEQSGGSFALVTKRFIPILDVGSEAAPAVLDLEGEGGPDLVIGNVISPFDPLRASVAVLENEGPGRIDLTSVDAVPFVGFSAVPSAADLDCDLDPDLYVGSFDGKISSFKASRSESGVTWLLDDPSYAGIDVGSNSAPSWVDIDADGDPDLFVGKGDGTINLYRNIGSLCQPAFTLEDESYLGIDVGQRSRPAFVDYDSDGDADLFVGSDAGVIEFFRNEGSPAAPQFVSGESIPAPVPGIASPALADFDGDGDPDLVVGTSSGGLLYYRNDRIVLASEGLPRPLGSLEITDLYPNPASDVVELGIGTDGHTWVRIEVVDVLGRVKLRRTEVGSFVETRRVQVEVGALPQGLYVVRILTLDDRDQRLFAVAR